MDMGLTNSGAFDARDVDAALRPLGWSELCARLVAAQDLRRIQDPRVRVISGLLQKDRPHSEGTGGGFAKSDFGSFHRVAALMLESGRGRQDFVNPTSSSSGKDAQGKPVDTREPPLIERDPRQADENRHD
jgi:hypothetical protein